MSYLIRVPAPADSLETWRLYKMRLASMPAGDRTKTLMDQADWAIARLEKLGPSFPSQSPTMPDGH